jgi:hypothetical protein
MKKMLGVMCLSLGLTSAAVAGEVKTIVMNGVPSPIVVTVAAGQMMRILSCVYDGVESVNGNPASPLLTYTPGTQTQGVNLHALGYGSAALRARGVGLRKCTPEGAAETAATLMPVTAAARTPPA